MRRLCGGQGEGEGEWAGVGLFFSFSSSKRWDERNQRSRSRRLPPSGTGRTDIHVHIDMRTCIQTGVPRGCRATAVLLEVLSEGGGPPSW